MRTVAEKIRAKVTNIEELTITEDKTRQSERGRIRQLLELMEYRISGGENSDER
jgi:ADP-ribose pyrophosphatase YjhB (NUDIX family)